MISGWILDPDRKKMSKGKGNALTPIDVLDRYGSDAGRYWAANGRPGVDTAFDEGQMKIGRRLATKLLNASSFVLGLGRAGGRQVAPSRWTGRDAGCPISVRRDTASFDDYDYTGALTATEAFFWGSATTTSNW